MHKTLKTYIQAGYDNNMIVTRTKGGLTVGLAKSMREVADEHELELDTLYVPKKAITPVFQPGNMIYGFYIQAVELDMDYYHIELKGTLPKEFKQIIVAVGDSDVLLGAY